MRTIIQSARRLRLPNGGLRQRVAPLGTTSTFTTSVPRADSLPTLPSILQPRNETENVSALDRLLKIVRARRNPAHSFAVPLGNPQPWSETLLRSSDSMVNTIDEASPRADVVHNTPRTMQDSYTEVLLPFGSSPKLLEQYTNVTGGIRTGKLMEHLDSLAGSIAYKHMLGPGVETLGSIDERGFYIVTASVERLDVMKPLDPHKDLRLSGQVIYTGSSSMEVAVKMESLNADGSEESTVLIGRFSMVCRDAKTSKAKKVNPLIANSEEERTLFAMGQAIKEQRKQLALVSLSLVPPTSEEANALHQTHLRFGSKEGEYDGVERVWMGKTRKEKTMVMFPQERNIHQKIFGGYLMRLAYELGFANACLFTRSHVHFLSLDSISFAKPVPIGSILRLTSHVLYSNEVTGEVHVGVQANVMAVETGTEQMTNDFRFTWRKDGGGVLGRRVVPRTYNEAMLWLEGRRAMEAGAKIRGLRAF